VKQSLRYAKLYGDVIEVGSRLDEVHRKAPEKLAPLLGAEFEGAIRAISVLLAKIRPLTDRESTAFHKCAPICDPDRLGRMHNRAVTVINALDRERERGLPSVTIRNLLSFKPYQNIWYVIRAANRLLRPRHLRIIRKGGPRNMRYFIAEMKGGKRDDEGDHREAATAG